MFVVEFGKKVGDDFDKKVLNDFMRFVEDFIFGNDFVCGDVKDGIFCFENEVVDELIIVVVNFIVGNG